MSLLSVYRINHYFWRINLAKGRSLRQILFHLRRCKQDYFFFPYLSRDVQRTSQKFGGGHNGATTT